MIKNFLFVMILIPLLLFSENNMSKIEGDAKSYFENIKKKSSIKKEIKDKQVIITVNKQKFYIGKDIYLKVNKTYPDLIDLILLTESMDNDERQYWLDILPAMTKKQIKRLFDILYTEIIKLSELEKKYFKEISKLNKKHLYEFQVYYFKKIIAKQKENNKTIPSIPLLVRAKVNKNNYFTIIKYIDSKEDDNITLYLYSYKEQNRLLNNHKLPLSEKDIILQYWLKIQNIKKDFRNIYEEMNQTSEYIDLLKLIGDTAIDLKHEPILRGVVKELKQIVKLDRYKKYRKKINNINQYLEISYYRDLKRDLKTYITLYRDYYKKDNYIITDLLYLTYAKYDNNASNEAKNLLKDIFNYMDNNNILQVYMDKKYKFQTEPIILDIVTYFNKDLVSNSLKQKIEIFNNKVTNDRNLTTSSYYYELNRDYIKKKTINEGLCLSVNKKEDLKSTLKDEGCKLETLTYKAFLYIKQSNYQEAKKLLQKAKEYGESEYSDANDYIEKDLILFLDKRVDDYYQHAIVLLSQIKQGVYSILDYATKYTEKFIVFITIIILAILILIAIFFPSSKLIRTPLINKFIYSEYSYFVLFFKNFITKKLIAAYNKHSYPTVNFLPYEEKMGKNDFLKKYVPMFMKNKQISIDKEIYEILKEKNNIIIYGKGGVGKTLTSYKVATFYNELLIWINYNDNLKNIVSSSQYVELYSNDKYITNMLNKFNYNSYVFIIDNYYGDQNELNILKANISAKYKNSKLIVTSRQNYSELTKYEINEQSINFERFLKDLDSNKINYLKTFISKVRNPLLISIILQTDIDISKIIETKDYKNKIEQIIIGNYIEKHIEILCKQINNANLPSDSCNHFWIKFLFYIANTNDNSISNIINILNKNFKDPYELEILNSIETYLGNKIQIIEQLTRTSILYKNKDLILFSHDLIKDYLKESI